jgi:hypothetical protein
MQYLQEEGVFPYVFPWLAGSPDANPIEKLWNLMKQRISVRSRRPVKKDTLITAIREEWGRFTALEIGELTASLPGCRQFMMRRVVVRSTEFIMVLIWFELDCFYIFYNSHKSHFLVLSLPLSN